MSTSAAPPPPLDEHDLLARARALRGLSLSDLDPVRNAAPLRGGLRQKGKIGEALERALGATPGGGAVHDFPHLGIELKTIPVDSVGVPHESTFVCALRVGCAERMDWRVSWVRAKLARVLWVPIVGPRAGEPRERRVGDAILWAPTASQERVLGADFDEIVGRVGAGGIEDVTAHLGRWLQLRPKAASGRARTHVLGPGGELVATVPRGFYLRPRFTGALLRDPAAEPQ